MKYSKVGDFYRVDVTNPEDLWYLSLIIRSGDLVRSEVFRRAENRDDALRSKKREREKVTVTLKVESVEFSELQMRIHILGEILEGPEDYIGEHQSVNVDVGSSILVLPSNLNSFLKTLEEATSLSYSDIYVISVDEKSVSCYLVNESRNELMWSVQTSQGKMFEDRGQGNFNELKSKLERMKGTKVYLIGPQVLRGSIIKLLSEYRIVTENTEVGESGDEGIKALLASSSIDMRRATEMKLVDLFLKGVSSGFSVYGRERVSDAINAGAVETVIITDKYFIEENAFQILDICARKGTKVFVVHSSWETGKIISSYGGIVGILRYRVEI
ncbi:MAG: hypothetical protein QXT54_00845 [Thermoplasmatales archaeon]